MYMLLLLIFICNVQDLFFKRYFLKINSKLLEILQSLIIKKMSIIYKVNQYGLNNRKELRNLKNNSDSITIYSCNPKLRKLGRGCGVK